MLKKRNTTMDHKLFSEQIIFNNNNYYFEFCVFKNTSDGNLKAESEIIDKGTDLSRHLRHIVTDNKRGDVMQCSCIEN